MPKAEVGSTKHLNNKLKSKGLQRLRWYCQVCERQMRDENGFKMHTQSESHVRQMLLVGEDPKKFIEGYSRQFQRDFLTLLRTSHGEKPVHLNQFYQSYIANKEHVHMNATKWPSLTEFAKFVGREGICRVEETDKGLHIAWIDNSPEALRRQDAIRKKDRQDKGDEEREQALIREQIKRANMEARTDDDDNEDNAARELKRQEGEKITLNFSAKPAASKTDAAAPTTSPDDVTEQPAVEAQTEGSKELETIDQGADPVVAESAAPAKVSLKLGASSKPKNVFSVAKKNALGGKKSIAIEQPKKMSEAERIMREELERKKRGSFQFTGGPAQKRQRF